MLAHMRRLLAHSIVYGFAETASRGIGFILVFFYGLVLSKEDIGLRSTIYGIPAVVGLLYTLGLDNAFLRYFMDPAYRDDKKKLFSTAVVFSTGIGIALLAAAWFADKNISALVTKETLYSPIIRILFVILILDNIVIFPTLILRAENRLAYFSFIALARFVLFIVANILFVWMWGRGLRGVFEANIIVVFIVSVLLFPVFREYFTPTFSGRLLKILLIFGVPTIFTVLCMRLIDYSDRYVILYLLGDSGAERLGSYTMPYTLGMVGIMTFVNSFRLAWQPFFLSLKDDPENTSIFSRVATYYTIFIGLVFAGVTLFRQEIFTLYARKYPVELADIIPLVSLAYIFFGYYIIMQAGVFIREKTRYLPIVTLAAAAVNLGLNFVFVPIFGITGAAYTTIIAYAVLVSVMYAISTHVYKVRYEFSRIIAAALIVAIPVLAGVLLRPSNTIADFLYRAGLYILIPVMLWLSGILYQSERQAVIRIISTRMQRFRRSENE